MFKFLHCADLHIDSPLHGLSRQAEAPVRELRLATRQALANLVDLAIEESVAFVVIAGDIFDGDWLDYSTGLYFNAQMAHLGQAGIRVLMVSGNHDAESQISRYLSLPENVTRLSVQAPETVVLDDVGVAIHGQGFATRDVRDNLVPAYPAPIPGYFNLGLLHCSVDGQGGHETYAPCKLEDLLRKGYDYWALGHIHQPGVLHRDPFVVYSGNLQGRHVRETGARGAMLVTVDGRTVTPAFRPLDVIRWEVASVDLLGVEREADLIDRVTRAVECAIGKHGTMPIALRVELKGVTPLHGDLLAREEYWRGEIENLAITRGPGRVWLEAVKIRTALPTSAGSRLGDDAWAALDRTMARLAADRDFLDQFVAEMARFERRLGPAYQAREDATLIRSVDDVLPLMRDADALIRRRMQEEESGR